MTAVSTIKKKRRRLRKVLIRQGHSEAHASNLAQGEMNRRYGHGWQSVGASAGFWTSAKTTPDITDYNQGPDDY